MSPASRNSRRAAATRASTRQPALLVAAKQSSDEAPLGVPRRAPIAYLPPRVGKAESSSILVLKPLSRVKKQIVPATSFNARHDVERMLKPRF